MNLEKLPVPASWEVVFADSIDEFEDLNEILNENIALCGRIFPAPENIFKAFELTPLDEVKVVIIGQDPYHQMVNIRGKNVPRAQGLAFSVDRDDEIPSSLQNILAELKNTVPGFQRPTHGDLTRWTYQGVLLLNMCLTVNPNSAGSHGAIWLGFIKKVITAIAAVNKKCIYVLWGREAQKLSREIGSKGVILEAAHPSGLSAHRGFFGCNHFNLINEMLIEQNKTPVNWNLNPPKIVLQYKTPKKVEHKTVYVPGTGTFNGAAGSAADPGIAAGSTTGSTSGLPEVKPLKF